MHDATRCERFPLLSVDEFRLLLNVKAFLPHYPLEDPVAFLQQHYLAERTQDAFMEHGAVIGDFREHSLPPTQQRILFYPHWGGHRTMQILYLKSGGKLSLLVDRESVAQAEKFQWDDFFRQFGDIRWIVAEEPMAVRRILRDVAEGRSIAISIDGNRGHTEQYLSLPFSPYVNYRFRIGGLKTALRTGLPIAYMAAPLDAQQISVRLKDVTGEDAEGLARGLLDAFTEDLTKAPHWWKLWKRASKDHHVRANPRGSMVCVRFKNDTYFGNTGSGKLVPLSATASQGRLDNGREYISRGQIGNDIIHMAG